MSLSVFVLTQFFLIVFPLLAVSQTCFPLCGPSEYCGNSTQGGGPTCLACNQACDGCTGPGPDACLRCAAQYYQAGTTCRACNVACDGCTGAGPEDCNTCAAGYYPVNGVCTVCEDGKFGVNCTGTCHCLNGAADCRKSDGLCQSFTCEWGWSGVPYCQTPCDPNFYGKNCAFECHCPVNDTCSNINGLCSSGRCHVEYGGPGCQILLPKLKDPPSVSNNVCGNITVTFKKWVEDFDIGNGPIGEYRLEVLEQNSSTWIFTDRYNNVTANTVSKTYTNLDVNRLFSFRVNVIRSEEGGKLMSESTPGFPTPFFSTICGATTPTMTTAAPTTRAPATVQPDNCTTTQSTVPQQWDVRIVGPDDRRGLGFVEVYLENQWRAVCDDLWGTADAQVVCRKLCFSAVDARAGSPIEINYLRPNVSSVYGLDDVECQGNEASLSACQFKSGAQIDCSGSDEYASVACSKLDNAPPSPPVPILECVNGRIKALFSRANDGNLIERFLSIFDTPSGVCNVQKTTDANYVSISIPFDECGTKITTNDTHIVYSNVIRYDYTSTDGNVYRVNAYRVEVSCEFPRDLGADNGMIPQTESVTQKAPGTFNIRMDFFQNNTFDNPVSGFPLNLTLGEWLNVALTLENVDSNLKLVVPDCMATPSTDENDLTNYPLFENKCQNDPTLGFFPMNSTSFGYRYQTFKFVNFDQVYLHCKAFVCLLSEKTAECDRSCNSSINTTPSPSGRRRREAIIREPYNKQVYHVRSQAMSFNRGLSSNAIIRHWNTSTTISTTPMTTSSLKPTSTTVHPTTTTTTTATQRPTTTTTQKPSSTTTTTQRPTTTTTQKPSSTTTTTQRPTTTTTQKPTTTTQRPTTTTTTQRPSTTTQKPTTTTERPSTTTTQKPKPNYTTTVKIEKVTELPSTPVNKVPPTTPWTQPSADKDKFPDPPLPGSLVESAGKLSSSCQKRFNLLYFMFFQLISLFFISHVL